MKFLSKVPQPQKTIIIVVATVILVPIILFIGLVIYRIPAAFEREKTAETIEFIQSQKLTMEDVLGENLPPTPDPALVDATVEGVDANNNLIRDDVELAIFERYPNDVVIRSAMLQYAMGLQLELTQVFNSETWVAAVEESERGSGCLFSTSPDVSLESTQAELNLAFAVGDSRIREVEQFVINNDLRQKRADEVIQYITSYGNSDKESRCDINPVIFISNTSEE